MDAIVSRIRQIIDYQKLSDRAFAIKCNIGPSTLDMQMKGKRAVSLDTINSILSTFENVSAEWLMRGDGAMIKGEIISPDYDRLNKLVDTIATLQGVINDRSESLALALERIKFLESQLK